MNAWVRPRRALAILVWVGILVLVVTAGPTLLDLLNRKTIVESTGTFGGKPYVSRYQVRRWGEHRGERHGTSIDFYPDSDVIMEREEFHDGAPVGTYVWYDDSARPRRIIEHSSIPNSEGWYPIETDTFYGSSGEIVQQYRRSAGKVVEKRHSPPWLWGKVDLRTDYRGP